MLVHDTVRWGFRAKALVASVLPRFISRSIKHRTLNDAILMLHLPVLLESVELDLKRRLESFLPTTRGSTWWDTLPRDVQRKAQLRWRWSSQESSLRLPHFSDTVWLSIGDTLNVLSALDTREWRICMDSETGRRKVFQQYLRSVKSFRDLHVGHPKPRNPTLTELKGLCTAITQMPAVIRPTEWQAAHELLEAIQHTTVGERRALIREGMQLPAEYEYSPLENWAREMAHHKQWLPRTQQVRWRRQFLSYMANLDPGGGTFFGIKQW